MLIRVLDNREVEIIYEESEGSQNENRITTFNLEVPQDYSEFIKKIVFITEDGNFFDYIENDVYILKNNITKYKKVKSYIWLTNTTTNQDFRSKLFDLSFNYNENPSDYVPSEQEQSQWDLMVEELEELIEEVQALPTLKREIVEELPTEDIDPDTIYMVLRSNTEPNNVYDEYMYIEDEWEKIGSTEVDLSNYYTKTEADEKFDNTEIKEQIETIETDLYGEVEYNVTTGEKVLNGTKEDRDLAIPKIYGYSEQESTNGYQLIEDSLNGYTIGSTGGVTGSSDYNLYIGKVEESQNYIISGDSIDSTIVLGFFENKPATNSTTYNNSRTVLSNVATFTAPITRLCCN